MKFPRRAAAVAAPLLVLSGLTSVPTAQAHPLGNFSVNHYDGLRLSHDGIEDIAVVDSAEIPTAQDEEATDTDHDGTIASAEAADRAADRCARLAGRTRVSVDGRRIAWHVNRSTLTYGKGAAGVPVARLTCTLRAEADLSRPADIAFASGADAKRTGWKEITAVPGDRVGLAASSVPSRSPSDGLRHYPGAGTEQPLAVTTAELRTEPGRGAAGAPGAPGPGAPGASPAVQALDRGTMLFPALERRLTGLTAGRDLTWSVGLLAVLLTLLLGAGHAALPGHAKLAVAACLARRDGGVRAALAVGTTVTATHTAGVLAMGLILTAGAGLAGERLLAWLGAISGALIAALGVVLVVTAVRAVRTGRPPADWHHGHGHPHGHGQSHGPTHNETREHALAHGPRHDHPHAHDHAPGLPHSHSHSHSHGHDDRTHEADLRASKTPRRTGLPALVGVGLAAGLVPSPSALVVLLGAIALSQTLFGVLLVVGYGLGMAITLTAAGLLLSGGGSRLAALSERHLPSLRRCTRYATVLTALAVLTVGISLTLRSLLTL
ncbi:nickel transporter [Streptomyces sp. ID05-18]|uniref:nickel transporter n=1 Tax=Streptomyces sp. ID05-18 TaxID=3028662 RepID=UPI0029BD330D|nr:nickel transporter [Streptomyces sp. ID05-18]MDX3484593.1 nickel transporter [Streptomyces sp. ID05-18]